MKTKQYLTKSVAQQMWYNLKCSNAGKQITIKTKTIIYLPFVCSAVTGSSVCFFS